VATSAETDKIGSSLRARALLGKLERLTERHENEKFERRARNQASKATFLMQLEISAQKSYEK
jgi:hypothetical protein